MWRSKPDAGQCVLQACLGCKRYYGWGCSCKSLLGKQPVLSSSWLSGTDLLYDLGEIRLSSLAFFSIHRRAENVLVSHRAATPCSQSWLAFAPRCQLYKGCWECGGTQKEVFPLLPSHAHSCTVWKSLEVWSDQETATGVSHSPPRDLGKAPTVHLLFLLFQVTITPHPTPSLRILKFRT